MGKDHQFRWQGINRFNKGIILSLIGFCLLLMRDHVDASFLKKLISMSGYLLALAGFVVAGYGKAQYWRDMYSKEDKKREK